MATTSFSFVQFNRLVHAENDMLPYGNTRPIRAITRNDNRAKQTHVDCKARLMRSVNLTFARLRSIWSCQCAICISLPRIESLTKRIEFIMKRPKSFHCNNIIVGVMCVCLCVCACVSTSLPLDSLPKSCISIILKWKFIFAVLYFHNVIE